MLLFKKCCIVKSNVLLTGCQLFDDVYFCISQCQLREDFVVFC